MYLSACYNMCTTVVSNTSIAHASGQSVENITTLCYYSLKSNSICKREKRHLVCYEKRFLIFNLFEPQKKKRRLEGFEKLSCET